MNHPSLAKNPLLRLWLPAAITGVIAISFAYVAVQQNYRMAADDPQIQLAEDTAAALAHGATPASLIPAGAKVGMSSSLAPFLIVTDENLHVLASSGQLGAETVIPPTGSFEAAKSSHGKDTAQPQENRITWQPIPTVRNAAVIVHYDGGYVVAARNLREVETRINNLTFMAATAIAALLIANLILAVILK